MCTFFLSYLSLPLYLSLYLSLSLALFFSSVFSIFLSNTFSRALPSLQVSDGAAAVLVSRASFAASMNLPVLGILRSYAGILFHG